MDSHPPLAARLERLGVPLAAVRDAALDVTPASTAIHLVRGYEQIEGELSAIIQRYAARALGVAPATEGA